MIKIWNAETGTLQITLDAYKFSVTSVSFSQDGRLASGSDDATVRIWDAQTGALKRTLDNIFGISSVHFCHDGRQLAVGFRSSSSKIRIWDALTGAPQGILNCDAFSERYWYKSAVLGISVVRI
jgi:WD40 repeat protein